MRRERRYQMEKGEEYGCSQKWAHHVAESGRWGQNMEETVERERIHQRSRDPTKDQRVTVICVWTSGGNTGAVTMSVKFFLNVS